MTCEVHVHRPYTHKSLKGEKENRAKSGSVFQFQDFYENYSRGLLEKFHLLLLCELGSGGGDMAASLLPYPRPALSHISDIQYTLFQHMSENFHFTMSVCGKQKAECGDRNVLICYMNFLIFCICIKFQSLDLEHFQIILKQKWRNISIGMIQAAHQIFTHPFTPLNLQ